MSTRTITLLIAILSTLATILSTLTGPEAVIHLKPEQALLVGAVGAGLYGLVRALQKVRAGTPWKALLATTEAKGAALVYAAGLFTALANVVPAQYAGYAMAIVTALGVLGRMIGPKKDGETKGGGAGPLAAAVVLLGVLTASPARAQEAKPEPQLGFCNKSNTWCTAPALAITAIQINLKTGDYERVALGAGYGVVYKGWKVNLGVGLYGGIGISNKQPNAPQGHVLFSVANLGAVGFGFETYRDPTNPNHRIWQGLLTGAISYDIGGSTSFIEKILDGIAATGKAPMRAGCLKEKDFE